MYNPKGQVIELDVKPDDKIGEVKKEYRNYQGNCPYV